MSKIAFFTAYDNFALGIRLLASYLEQKGHECHLIFLKKYKIKPIKYPSETPWNYEYTDLGTFLGTGYDVDPWSEIEEELLYDKISDISPDIIGSSSRNFLDKKLIEMLKKIKSRCSDALVLAGGFGPTFKPELYLKACDYVVAGEGEKAMLEIAEAVDHGDLDKIKKIKNIVYSKNGKVVRNELRPLLVDFKDLPFPKIGKERIYHIQDNTIYDTDDFRGVYNIFYGRGCLNNCSFCCAGQWSNLYKNSGHAPIPYRRRSINNVMEELKRAKEMGFRNISFVDSYFGATYEEQRDFLQRYENEIGLPFFAHFHPEIALKHPDLIDLACKGGLHSTVVGIQSGSEKFAREIYNRKNSNKSLLKFAQLLSKHESINIQYHFILSNPLETAESFSETLDFIKKLADDPNIRIKTVGVHRLRPFPNTPISDMIEKQNAPKVTAKDWIYQSQMAHLRLWLNDKKFFKVYNNKKYHDDVNLLIKKSKSVMIKNRVKRFLERLKKGKFSEIFEGTRKKLSKLKKLSKK